MRTLISLTLHIWHLTLHYLALHNDSALSPALLHSLADSVTQECVLLTI